MKQIRTTPRSDNAATEHPMVRSDFQTPSNLSDRKLMDEAVDRPAVPDPKKPWFEPAAAILMAVASLSTAWCSFQNSRWSGQTSQLGTHADKLEGQAAAWHLEARQIESLHTRFWMEAMDAALDGDQKLARFYTDRFADELKPAYEKWIALKPFENPAAAPHPFYQGLYMPRFEREIRDANTEAALAEAKSKQTGHLASSYLSNTVLLATVLFFAGTASKFDQRRVRWASLAFAVSLFLYAAVRMLMLPVA